MISLFRRLAARVRHGAHATDPMGRFLTAHLEPGGCAFDIGANCGNYTAVMANRVGPSGTVVAFEPNPELCGRLRAAVPAPHVRVEPVAVSGAENPDREFYIDTRPGMPAVGSSLQRLGDLHSAGQVRSTRVRTITIDGFCASAGVAPGLIKIDVEGHELDVFRGAVETINRLRPVVVFEFWETWWGWGGKQIFDYLREHYRLVRLADGLDVTDWYYTHTADGVADIGGVPRAESRTASMRPELLDRPDAERPPR